MKRSEINGYIREVVEFIEAQNFHLPPFAYWSLAEWKSKGEASREIVDAGLGWDVIDFGSGNYREIGLTLFTIRNGVFGDSRYPKTYCEKLLIIGEGQVTPAHHHRIKMEDIIVRGGGNLLIEVRNASEEGELLDTPVKASIDGTVRTFGAGDIVRLEPGESITLEPYNHHRFWGEEGAGTVLSGEVSTVNDDVGDNVFIPEVPRFTEHEEDEAPLYVLCNEYAKFGILS